MALTTGIQLLLMPCFGECKMNPAADWILEKITAVYYGKSFLLTEFTPSTKVMLVFS